MKVPMPEAIDIVSRDVPIWAVKSLWYSLVGCILKFIKKSMWKNFHFPNLCTNKNRVAADMEIALSLLLSEQLDSRLYHDYRFMEFHLPHTLEPRQQLRYAFWRYTEHIFVTWVCYSGQDLDVDLCNVPTWMHGLRIHLTPLSCDTR